MMQLTVFVLDPFGRNYTATTRAFLFQDQESRWKLVFNALLEPMIKYLAEVGGRAT
jgi:hypothetical protein